VEGKDYHVIQGKKSLAKGGAEKIASIFGWSAKFVKDQETYDMLNRGVKGTLVVYMCYLYKMIPGEPYHTLGQGRGAAILEKNGNDPNKTIKMAQKSSYIDAVIRASGMSDFFTQDLEDMNVNDISQPTNNIKTDFPPSVKQLETIKKVMDEKGLTEADVIDQGFNLKQLTGGKDGTASELIGFLFKYQPNAIPSGNIFQTLKERLENSFTSEALNMVGTELNIAFKNHRITDEQFEILVELGTKKRDELNEKEGRITGDNIPFDLNGDEQDAKNDYWHGKN